MKLVMDEKLKHRLIGVAVILSIATIFTPAIVRKSTQHMDSKVSMAVTLPPKPVLPKITKVEERELLQSTRVAEVELPPVVEEKSLPQLAQAEPFVEGQENLAMEDTGPTELIPESRLADFELAKADALQPIDESVDTTAELEDEPTVATAKTPVDEPMVQNTSPRIIEKPKAKSTAKSKKAVTATPKPVAAKRPANVSHYSIQLASFNKESNANALLKNLKKQGYSARITTVKNDSSKVYKVHVGHIQDRKAAEKLKNQLASNFQIKGFIVSTTGVS